MSEVAANVVDCYVFRRRGCRAEFLMLHRSPRGTLGDTWQAVHGRIEPGETAAQAALRELSEETGLKPVGFWQLESVNTFFVARQDRVLMCPGFAAEVQPDAEVRLSDEHVDFRWEPGAVAREAFLWPGQRRAVAEILDIILPGATAEPHLRLAFP